MTSVECARCHTVLEGRILACPVCSGLLFSDRLKALAASAEQSATSGDLAGALGSWRDALELVPRGTEQHEYITAQIAALGQRVEQAGQRKPAWAKAMGPVGGVVVLLLTKGKLLLLGLSKLPTLGSMLLSFGGYAYEFGWPFGLGLVLSIYIHEIGHVHAAHRYGMKVSAPMFIPFVGAFVSLKQQPVAPRENAVISVAGPIWGAAGAALTFLAWWITGQPALLAIAETAAVMNLFNLLPVPPLDGAGIFRALHRPYRILAAVAILALWALTRKHMLLLLAAGAVWQCFRRERAAEGCPRSLLEYAAVATALAAMLWCVPAPSSVNKLEGELNVARRIPLAADDAELRAAKRHPGITEAHVVGHVE